MNDKRDIRTALLRVKRSDLVKLANEFGFQSKSKNKRQLVSLLLKQSNRYKQKGGSLDEDDIYNYIYELQTDDGIEWVAGTELDDKIDLSEFDRELDQAVNAVVNDPRNDTIQLIIKLNQERFSGFTDGDFLVEIESLFEDEDGEDNVDISFKKVYSDDKIVALLKILSDKGFRIYDDAMTPIPLFESRKRSRNSGNGDGEGNEEDEDDEDEDDEMDDDEDIEEVTQSFKKMRS